MDAAFVRQFADVILLSYGFLQETIMLTPPYRIAAATLGAALAAALAGSAHAESTFREFTYIGLFHEEGGQFLPNASIYGHFDSDDLNGNGVIERNEVTSFVINSQEYVAGCGPEV